MLFNICNIVANERFYECYNHKTCTRLRPGLLFLSEGYNSKLNKTLFHLQAGMNQDASTV